MNESEEECFRNLSSLSHPFTVHINALTSLSNVRLSNVRYFGGDCLIVLTLSLWFLHLWTELMNFRVSDKEKLNKRCIYLRKVVVGDFHFSLSFQ